MAELENTEEIENLPELLQDVLGDSNIKTIEIKRLTAPGENYGSLMLKVDITSTNKNNEDEELHLVAKKIPAEEFFQESFNVQVTFKNEVAMYQVVIPTLQKFQEENDVKEVINCFPKFFAARSNLNGGDVVDEDAVLVLENLTAAGFRNIDRTEGFNFESTKKILKDLAEFHAVPLALRIRRPDIFDKELRKYCHEFKFQKDFHQKFWQPIKDIIEEKANCSKLVHKISFLCEIDRPQPNKHFATLVHHDLWCNNTMQTFSETSELTKNIFLDFQFLAYGSPASDLFFFLWTSVQLPVLQKHFEDLLQYYHSHFVKTLKSLKCDINVFSYENFLEEIKSQCRFEIAHTLQFVIFVVHGKKLDMPIDIEKVKKNISPKAKEITWFMMEECERRGWISK